MPSITIDDLKSHIDVNRGTCISLFLPTHVKGSETEQDQIRLKNALKQAGNKLKELNLRQKEIDKMLGPAEDLFKSRKFWQHLDRGLAVYLYDGEMKFYLLPITVDELVIAANEFHIKPLIPLLGYPGKFYILALSLKKIRLYEGISGSLNELTLENTPVSFEEAMQFEDPEKQIQYHTGTPGAGGKRPAQFHGQGGGTDKSKEKKDILRFFQAVDNGLYKLIGKEKAPLFLIGLDYLHSIYRKANSYSGLHETGSETNADDLSDDDVYGRLKSVIEEYFGRRLREALDEYHNKIGTGLASNDFEDVVRAAFEGRIEVLMGAVGMQSWGRFDRKTMKMDIREIPEPGDIDLIDFAASRVLITGGKVFALEPDIMPDGKLLAAIYRHG